LTWVLRYYKTRADGKRVEHTVTVGLVKNIGPKKADASREADRQKLRETINQLQPFQGKPRTFGQLCQHYIENELRIDQSTSARPKEFPTIETDERHLIKRIIPRWGNLAPLQVKSTEFERWFLELRKGNPQEKIKPYADPTVDKIRRIMHLVYKHGQRHEFLPRQQEGNPMNWVSQRTTSDYTAVPMTPKQAFEVLLNIPEPRRTLTLSDAATALRVSELLALMWMDLDFRELVMYVRRAYVWGRFKVPKSKASKAPFPIHPLLAGFLLAWREKNAFPQGHRLRVPERRAQGQEAPVRFHHGAELPAAGSGESGSHQVRREGAFWLSQFPALARNRVGKTESGSQNGAGDAASRGLRDHHAALCAVRHGADARRPRQVPGAATGRQNSPANGDGSMT
jgi:integrase